MKRLWLHLALLTGLLLGSAYAQDVKEVTFWTGHGEPDLSAIQQIVDNFNSEHDDINVSLVQIPPGDVTDVTRLMTAVRGGYRSRRVHARPVYRRAARRRRLASRPDALHER